MATLYAVDSTWIPAEVPESKLKEVERYKAHLAEKEAAVAKAKEEAEERHKALVARSEKYHEEYAAQEASEKKLKEEAKANGGFYKPADPKVILVVRIKGVNKMCPRVRKIFQLFRLYQLHNAVFVKVNKATMNMLRHIEPFVTFGYPDLESIRMLLYHRGYLRNGKMAARMIRTQIQSNDQIHERLGQFGIHGIEDMVHELYTAGPRFKEVSTALWTFKLNPPKGGFLCKRHGFAEFRKGDWGNREDLINDLVQRMIY